MSAAKLMGKVAVVTGGSGTIGQAIAKKLLSQGASVVLTGRRLEKLEQAQSKLLSSYPDRNVSVVSSDVSQEESVMQFFETIDQEHGGLDLLVNNAGAFVSRPVLFGTYSYEYVVPIMARFLRSFVVYLTLSCVCRNHGPWTHSRSIRC